MSYCIESERGRKRTSRVHEGESVGEALFPSLGIPLLALLPLLPLLPLLALLSTPDELTLLLSQLELLHLAGLSTPGRDDLLDDLEQRVEALTVDTILVQAGGPEGAKVGEVLLVGGGEILLERRGAVENLKNDALWAKKVRVSE